MDFEPLIKYKLWKLRKLFYLYKSSVRDIYIFRSLAIFSSALNVYMIIVLKNKRELSKFLLKIDILDYNFFKKICDY